jgi:2-polyprenyl-3-methyl-5-hydroxy-6-metoxy-1,4-benzoquinol methylase
MAENLVDSYGWQSPVATCASAYITPTILSILNGLGARRVLDLGSGNGALCGVLAARGFDVAGVENDREGVLVAQRAHPNGRFYNFGVQDDPGKLLAAEAQFDAVVSTEVIEHLFSPHLLPRFAHAVLAEGGHLVVTTPYHGYLKNLALAVLGKWDFHHDPLWHGGHVKFWSRATLSRLLAENGFEVVAFSGVGRLPYLWKSMALVARKK